MNLDDWRKIQAARAGEDVVPLTLPSGLDIMARRPGPLQLAMWSRLPLMLVSTDGGADAMSGEDALETAKFMRELLEFCWVSPVLHKEIQPSEIPDEDLQFLFQWAMRIKEAAAVRPFPGQRAAGGSVGDGGRVFVPAVGAAGDRGSGAGAGRGPRGSGAGQGDAQGGAAGGAGGADLSVTEGRG